MSEHASAEQVVRDMIHIHDERINVYKKVLRTAKDLEIDIRSIFERMIEQSLTFRQQLTAKLSKDNSGEGKLYHAWTGVKADSNSGDRKAILAACADDQLAMRNVYSLALSITGNERNIKELLASQELGVKELYAHIRQFHDAQ